MAEDDGWSLGRAQTGQQAAPRLALVATGFGSRGAQRRITMRAEAPPDDHGDSLEPPSFLRR